MTATIMNRPTDVVRKVIANAIKQDTIGGWIKNRILEGWDISEVPSEWLPTEVYVFDGGRESRVPLQEFVSQVHEYKAKLREQREQEAAERLARIAEEDEREQEHLVYLRSKCIPHTYRSRAAAARDGWLPLKPHQYPGHDSKLIEFVSHTVVPSICCERDNGVLRPLLWNESLDKDGRVIKAESRFMVFDPEQALSKTEWKRRGYVVKADEYPHAFASSGYRSYGVYRRDQVEKST